MRLTNTDRKRGTYARTGDSERLWHFTGATQLAGALTLARFARLAYANNRLLKATLAARTNLVDVTIIRSRNAVAWHALEADSNHAVIAICGSNDSLDWVHDLDAGQLPYRGGHVHRGFLEHAGYLWHGIENAVEPSRTYHITGHSLGGATAQIVAAELSDHIGAHVGSVSTFGAPRCFSPTAAAALSTMPIRRYVNTGDLVPSVPPRFWGRGFNHAGLSFYLSRQGEVYTERRLWLRRFLESQVARFGRRFVSSWHWAKVNHSILEYERRLEACVQ